VVVLTHPAVGFKMAFMSGFCVSAARLAMPDTGLISYGEMEDSGRHICEVRPIRYY